MNDKKVADALVDLYGGVIATNKNLIELGHICRDAAKAQTNINRRICLQVFAVSVSLGLAWIHIFKNSNKIEELNKEIEELKKGE